VKPPLVLLDANVIIEAHELGLWHRMVASFEVMVPAVVARHEAKYFVVGGQHNPIQLASLIAQNKVKELQADLSELSASPTSTVASVALRLVHSVDILGLLSRPRRRWISQVP